MLAGDGRDSCHEILGPEIQHQNKETAKISAVLILL